MKKTMKSIMLFAAAAMAFFGCAQIEDPTGGNVLEGIFTYKFDVVTGTKALLGEDAVNYEAGDVLGIYVESSAQIEGAVEVGETDVTVSVNTDTPLAEGNKVYAYYPYSQANASNAATAVTLAVPEAQTQKGAAFDADAMPMASLPYTVDASTATSQKAGNLYMCNLASMAEFNIFSTNASLAQETVKSVTFNSTTTIAGEFSLDLTGMDGIEEAPAPELTGKSVTTTIASAGAIGANAEAALKVYMVVGAGEHAGTVVVTTDRAVYTIEMTQAKTFVRSHVKPLGLDLAAAERNELKLELAQTSLVALDQARAYAIDLESGIAWTAAVSEGADWLTVTEAGEAGKGQLVVTTTATPDYFTKRDAEITVSAGSLKAIFKVSQGYGVLINGVIWGKYDVGQPGQFCEDFETIPPVYQYDSKIPYSVVGFVSGGTNTDSIEPEGWNGQPYAGGSTWAKENDPCPDGWRIPTADEMAALIGATYAAENITMGAERKFTWGWYYNHQGVYAGNADSASANRWDFKGNIFMVYAGYRGNLVDGYIQGHQVEADRVWRQTITRPSHNWSRINVVMSWNNSIGTWWMDNPYALAIRPVADLIHSPSAE